MVDKGTESTSFDAIKQCPLGFWPSIPTICRNATLWAKLDLGIYGSKINDLIYSLPGLEKQRTVSSYAILNEHCSLQNAQHCCIDMAHIIRTTIQRSLPRDHLSYDKKYPGTPWSSDLLTTNLGTRQSRPCFSLDTTLQGQTWPRQLFLSHCLIHRLLPKWDQIFRPWIDIISVLLKYTST